MASKTAENQESATRWQQGEWCSSVPMEVRSSAAGFQLGGAACASTTIHNREIAL